MNEALYDVLSNENITILDCMAMTRIPWHFRNVYKDVIHPGKGLSREIAEQIALEFCGI